MDLNCNIYFWIHIQKNTEPDPTDVNEKEELLNLLVG